MKATLIRGGRLIDPAQGLDGRYDLLLEGDRIAALEPAGQLKAQDAQVIDAGGLVVAPGLIDIHVHLREPGQSHKETIASGTTAAAAGGFTTVCAMPNTTPVNDCPQITEWMLAPERGAAIRVFPYGAATVGSMGEELTDFAALKKAGVVGVTDDGKPILDDGMMRATLESAARVGLPVIQHAEDTRMTGGCSMNAGALAFRLGLRGMAVEAESSLVERDIALVRKVKGARLHVAHLSTEKALKAVEAARAEGLQVTCEVAPHHFVLNEERVGDYDTNAKMNPPLRAEADRLAMVKGILEGRVDCIATDHAPHAAHEKEQEFERAPNGITGLETALGLTLASLHREHGMELAPVLAMLTSRPARVLGLAGRGTLAVGSYADVVLFDPDEKWVFRAQDSRSRSKNTPFDGWMMRGRVQQTISEGRIVFARK